MSRTKPSPYFFKLLCLYHIGSVDNVAHTFLAVTVND